ncbi:MAG: AraC family transcriptional regulator [Acidihalobacter sp.]|uniref:AraC family transcriptional regulator n=1 Tax=Acidihalobacter sp. TaxID=1872108 RepID=UPI00307D3FB5
MDFKRQRCRFGQGRKRLFLGNDAYVYDAHRFLITSVDLPVVTQTVEASSEEPYLGLTLELDLRAIAQLMLGQNMPRFTHRRSVSALR